VEEVGTNPKPHRKSVAALPC